MLGSICGLQSEGLGPCLLQERGVHVDVCFLLSCVGTSERSGCLSS